MAKEVVISHKPQTKMTSISEVVQTVETELHQEMESQVPSELWSLHDTNVGLIKSASPIRIQLKSNAQVPWKTQCPLKPEAEAGIKNIIKGTIDLLNITRTMP